MVSTRSKTKQTHLEDFADEKPPASNKPSKSPKPPKLKKQQAVISTSKSRGLLSPPPSPSKKRKVSSEQSKPEASKKKAKITKGAEGKEDQKDGEDSPIIINRAPVLHLWGASVTHFLYPSLSWSTCLSIGSAISTICAVSKGRSIGTIDQPVDTEENRRKKDDQRKAAEDLDELEVMQFKIKIKDGKAMFGGKPQSDKEETLRKKFGERYDEVVKTFEEVLEEWRGSEGELGERGFGMYEDFRPTVAKGQKGWGRKGVLDLGYCRKAVSKS